MSRGRAALALAGGLALAWMLLFGAFLRALPEAPEAPDARTDAIVVLTGGSGRLATGVDLLGRGRAERLFVSGVHPGVTVAELLRPLARAELAGAVVLGHAATDTRGNARETAAWAAGAGVRSLRLVTSAYHMPRARAEFARALPQVTLYAHPVLPPHAARGDWWQNPDALWLLVGEHAKYLASQAHARLVPLSESPRP